MLRREDLRPSILGRLAPLAAIALIGCGGPGELGAPPSQPQSGASAPAEPQGPATEPATAAAGVSPTQPGEAPRKGDEPVTATTPSRAVDPEQLVDVVKAEVKGGEESSGPTPRPYLWQPPAGEVAADEPMAVEVPLGLNPLTPVAVVPGFNPITKAKFELGKQLYFDPRVSKDATVSCATCHNPEKGWTDGVTTSIGIAGQVGSRNAPTVLNTAYGRTMFWDGRAPSLEAQAQGPIQNKIEMGDQSYEEIITRLRTIPGYQDQFKKIFGTEVTLDGMAKAVATFERAAALSGNSPYDQYIGGRGVDPVTTALSESAKRGMVLFGLELNEDDEFRPQGVVRKKAMCTSCHIGFNFTDEKFHNLGVGWDEKAARFADLGRWAVAPIGAKDALDIGSFKTPTIRDVTRTAPYMHDGSESSLEAVVEYYNRGGNKNPHLDADMKPLNLTDQEKADVVAFMKALTGTPIQVALPALPPGADGKSPDPAEALQPPSPKAALADPHAAIVR